MLQLLPHALLLRNPVHIHHTQQQHIEGTLRVMMTSREKNRQDAAQ